MNVYPQQWWRVFPSVGKLDEVTIYGVTEDSVAVTPSLQVLRLRNGGFCIYVPTKAEAEQLIATWKDSANGEQTT